MLKNRVWLLQKQIMDKICDVRIVDCLESSYIKPYRMEYKQNGRQRVWDLCKVHDSVACIVYNSTRDRLLFVTQFRPGVYMNRCSSVNGVVDTDRYPGSLGLTLELCAGITDKDKTVEQTMQEELEEEIGYHVPLDRIQKVIEMSPSEAQSVLMDESIMRPPSLLFAVQWWLANHASKFAAKEAADK
ncbi:uridine diphosphate glucose pyrophosphatase-like isoform X2 [Varroa destructor]|uniref:Nudix hydrolase domain-containing protein n=1 Tax=Varroa destructor TaxID=109461 RepID=A0A7M7K462_VARDE|nr:uridine diphosphate glucose pyrophosphatase-like isoform X2 [Varroa destructor]